MKLYIVSVRAPQGSGRYIDSFWVVHQHAVDRVKDLIASLQMSGKPIGTETDRWIAWWIEGTVPDAELATEEADPEEAQ